MTEDHFGVTKTSRLRVALIFAIVIVMYDSQFVEMQWLYCMTTENRGKSDLKASFDERTALVVPPDKPL
jgi:hypothetical protein